MTGVTRAAREAAIRRGEYVPIRELRLDPAVARGPR